MCAGLDDSSVVEDDDLVGMTDRVETVSYPFGSASIAAWMLAASAAATTSSKEASGRPKRMLSGDGVAEEERLLWDVADLVPQIVEIEIEVADVVAVDADRATSHVVHP